MSAQQIGLRSDETSLRIVLHESLLIYTRISLRKFRRTCSILKPCTVPISSKSRKTGRRGIAVYFDERRGKGGHGTLCYGNSFTIVQNRRKELPQGTLMTMPKQLGLSLQDLC